MYQTARRWREYVRLERDSIERSNESFLTHIAISGSSGAFPAWGLEWNENRPVIGSPSSRCCWWSCWELLLLLLGSHGSWPMAMVMATSHNNMNIRIHYWSVQYKYVGTDRYGWTYPHFRNCETLLDRQIDVTTAFLYFVHSYIVSVVTAAAVSYVLDSTHRTTIPLPALASPSSSFFIDISLSRWRTLSLVTAH